MSFTNCGGGYSSAGRRPAAAPTASSMSASAMLSLAEALDFDGAGGRQRGRVHEVLRL